MVITTPTTPPLWGTDWPPQPPRIDTPAPPKLPQAAGAWPGAGQTPVVLRTGRNPATGAPVHVPGQPEIPFSQLPPSGREQQNPLPSWQDPVTGAWRYIPPRRPTYA